MTLNLNDFKFEHFFNFEHFLFEHFKKLDVFSNLFSNFTKNFEKQNEPELR
jgi:hypothetical protein